MNPAHETEQELDPELAALLASAEDELPAPGASEDVDAMLKGVRGQIAEARKSPLQRIREQPTWRRRALGVATLLFLVGLSVGAKHPNAAAYPKGYLALYVVSIATLVLVCAFAALRPLHRPTLSRPLGVGLGLLAFLATVVLAVAPGFHDHMSRAPEGLSLFAHASPCFVYGFLVGVPVYAVLRILDRGNPLGRVLAASAAGLTGNLVLEMHCMVGGADHLLLGHAGMVGFYVLGVLALEWALRPRS